MATNFVWAKNSGLGKKNGLGEDFRLGQKNFGSVKNLGENFAFAFAFWVLHLNFPPKIQNFQKNLDNRQHTHPKPMAIPSALQSGPKMTVAVLVSQICMYCTCFNKHCVRFHWKKQLHFAGKNPWKFQICKVNRHAANFFDRFSSFNSILSWEASLLPRQS